MTYPIPKARRGLIFWLMIIAVIIISRLMAGPLTTPAAPYGIVSLELAGSEAPARAMIESWDAEVQRHARFSVAIDYLYLIAYSTAISLGCLWAATVLRTQQRLAAIGVYLAWLQWVAALLDAIENIGLWQMLQGNLMQPWPLLARWCAIPKFMLVALGIGYTLVLGGGAWLWQRMSRRRVLPG